MKWRSICSVTSKSVITPWRSGRTAEIVAAGTPEEVAGTPGSYTGDFLRDAGLTAAAPKARRGRRKVAAAA